MPFNFDLLEGKRIINIEAILNALLDSPELTPVRQQILRRRFSKYVCSFKDEPEYRSVLEYYCHLWNGLSGKFNDYKNSIRKSREK